MIKLEELVVGHYYAGFSSKGNIAQWDGDDFVLSVPPNGSEVWEHVFMGHPEQFEDVVYYGELFRPYEDLTAKIQKEYTDGES